MYKILEQQEINSLEPYIDDFNEQELAQYLYSKWYYDYDFFEDYFLKHLKIDIETGKYIKDCQIHKDIKDSFLSKENCVIIFPRWHWKTTKSLWVVIYDICYKRENGILCVMSENLWQEFLSKIRHEFETNDFIHAVFWHLVPQRTKEEQSKKWRWDYLQFTNWMDIQSITKGKAIRWARKTKIIIDDPEEDKDMKTWLKTKELAQWIAWTILPMFRTKWSVKVIGTVIHNDCLVMQLYNNAQGFNKVKHQWIVDAVFEKEWLRYSLVWWKPVRPDMFSIETLNKKLQDIQDLSPTDWVNIFKREYMNIPYADVWLRIFSDEHIESFWVITKYKKDVVFPKLRIYWEPKECWYWIDTASWVSWWDNFAISVRSLTWELLAFWYDNCDPDVAISVMDRLWELWYHWTFWPEINSESWWSFVSLSRNKPYFSFIYKRRNKDKTIEETKNNIWRRTGTNRWEMLTEYSMSLFWTEEFVSIKWIDERVADEMKTFINTGKRREHAKNCHDDWIFADAICLQIIKTPIKKLLI